MISTQIACRNGQLHSAQKEEIEQRVDHLTLVFDRVTSAGITITFHRNRVAVNIVLSVPRTTISATGRHDSLEVAIDMAMQKAAQQLRRFKSRLRDERWHVPVGQALELVDA